MGMWKALCWTQVTSNWGQFSYWLELLQLPRLLGSKSLLWACTLKNFGVCPCLFIPGEERREHWLVFVIGHVFLEKMMLWNTPNKPFLGLKETLPNFDILNIQFHVTDSLGNILYILIEFSAVINTERCEFSGLCYSPFLKGQAVLKLSWRGGERGSYEVWLNARHSVARLETKGCRWKSNCLWICFIR